VFNFGLTANHTNNGNDIEPDIAENVAILDVVVDGQLETLQLTIIDGLLGIAEEAVAAGFDFDEYHFVSVGGDDVDIAPT
jgi:hypothetical protein